ncbi:hypothetical protein ACOSQ3_028908 [Xanthoceras sorbifolium]
MHSDVIPFFRDVVHWSSSFVGNLSVASSPAGVTEISRCKDVKWKQPNAGCFKINTDAGANQVAQRLTKFGLTFFNDFVYLEDYPLCVESLVMNDCLR